MQSDAIFVLILSTCLASLAFFVRRFIQMNDKHHSEVDTKLSNLESVIEGNGKLVSASIDQVNVIASTMEKSAIAFQKDLNKELHDVHKSVTDIRGNVSTMQSAIVGVQEQMIKHQREMVKLREDVDGIKTTVKRLSDKVDKKKVEK
jgi:peptidoglycan hydrolase CwlO-like protein